MADTRYTVDSGFYDSVNQDRLYSADEMNMPYKDIISEGVFEASGGFEVTATSTPSMKVNVAEGTALLNGKWISADAKVLIVPNNTSLYPRKDSIILQVDRDVNVRAAALIYRTGTPAQTPQHPALETGDWISEFRIADITVTAGATSIVAGQITDTRGTEECPYASFKVGSSQLNETLMDILDEHPEYVTAVPDLGITTGKLANGAVTTEKLSAALKLLLDNLRADLDVKARIWVGDCDATADTAKKSFRLPEGVPSGTNLTGDYLVIELNNGNNVEALKVVLPGDGSSSEGRTVDFGSEDYHLDPGFYIFKVTSTTAIQLVTTPTSRVWFGTTGTSSSVQTKVVTCSEFRLYDGAIIAVRFGQPNAVDDPKINVNGTGAYRLDPALNPMPYGTYLLRFCKTAYAETDFYEIIGNVTEKSASNDTPKMDGTATPGTKKTFSRADHVHPTDTNLQEQITDVNTALTHYSSLKTSDYIVIPNGTDLNTLTTEGIYRIANQTTANSLLNAPEDAASGILRVYGSFTTTRFVQIYETNANIPYRQYGRFYNGSTWTRWEIVNYRSNYAIMNERVLITELISGYYDTTTGKATASTAWSRTSALFDASDFVGKSFYADGSDDVYITCYDANRTFLRAIHLPINSIILSDVSFIGVCVQKVTTELAINIRVCPDVIEYPFDDPNIYRLTNRWTNQNGEIAQVTTYDCVFVPGISDGDKFYSNQTGAVAVNCYGADESYLGLATYTDSPRHGRVYTVLTGTKYIYFNVSHAQQHGGEYSNLLCKITNKKILCIGDSITYLDGTTSEYDGATLFMGYQKALQKMGYEVVSAGYSGYTYATGVISGSTAIGSIYTQIVTNSFDVSGYDYIILLGGTNDDLYGVTVGSVPTSYLTDTFDTTTTAGALAGILAYIRQNNNSAQIILCTQTKSENASRSYLEAEAYAEMIRKMAEFASCILCDLFHNTNVQPHTSGWDDYFYDGTHPNKTGMERIGSLLLKCIE